MDHIYIRIKRPEGYEDVAPELVLEDFLRGGSPEAFEPEVIADPVAAERERWTLLLTEKWHAGDGKGQTLAQYMGMTEAEYSAWVLRA